MLNSTFNPDIHHKRKHSDTNYNCKIINTTGSKANDVDIQKAVIVMKVELEKAKEQILNVL